MSFRRYVYYCACCGGIAAYAGWVLDCWLPYENRLVLSGCKGVVFGVLVGATLGAVDARRHLATAKQWRAVIHVLIVAAVGALGGVIGGVFSEALYLRFQFELFRLPAWFIMGFVIGTGPGIGETVVRLVTRERLGSCLIRTRRGGLMGALGGFVGGCVYLLLLGVSHAFLTDTTPLWIPDAWGSVALGLCIGAGTALGQLRLGTPGAAAPGGAVPPVTDAPGGQGLH